MLIDFLSFGGLLGIFGFGLIQGCVHDCCCLIILEIIDHLDWLVVSDGCLIPCDGAVDTRQVFICDLLEF